MIIAQICGRLALGALLGLATTALVLAQQPPLTAALDQDQPGLVPDPLDEQLLPEFRPQPVYYRSTEPPGTIIIQIDDRFLYLVQDNKTAVRYGIGVGREGFQWSGLVKITRKQEWPDWRPPPEMIERQPYLPRFMAGGPGNPLGARAPIGFPGPPAMNRGRYGWRWIISGGGVQSGHSCLRVIRNSPCH